MPTHWGNALAVRVVSASRCPARSAQQLCWVKVFGEEPAKILTLTKTRLSLELYYRKDTGENKFP